MTPTCIFSDYFASSNSGHHFTIDCSNSHKGLFAGNSLTNHFGNLPEPLNALGIMVIVLTIISLVMFFVLTAKDNETGVRTNYAEFEVNIVELFLYIATTITVIVAMFQLRNLKYERSIGEEGILVARGLFVCGHFAGHGSMGLDNMLLAVAQTGMFIYSMFSIIGWYFTMEDTTIGLLADLFSFIQTCLQVGKGELIRLRMAIFPFRQCSSSTLGGADARTSPKPNSCPGES